MKNDLIKLPVCAISILITSCIARLKPFTFFEIVTFKSKFIDLSNYIKEYNNLCNNAFINDIHYPPVIDNAIRASYGHDCAWVGFGTVGDVSKNQIVNAATNTINYAYKIAKFIDNDLFNIIQSDTKKDLLLLKLSSKEQHWGDNSPIPDNILSLYADFDIQYKIDKNNILEITSFMEPKIIERINKNPNLLYSLNPREFEKFVAELFKGFGFVVELTARTHDGGYDVVAIKHDLFDVKYLIECKKYNSKSKICINTVRELHGVVSDQKATKGILVTTAHFTKNASKHLNKNKWFLEGKDFDDLLNWIDQYVKAKQFEKYNNIYSKFSPNNNMKGD